MNENSNGESMKFHAVYNSSRRRDDNHNDGDKCKTIVKIETQYMQKLGIKQGDVVKVSGNTKSTAATCLPTNPGELEEIESFSPDLDVEFLNHPEKKIQFPPKAIIYGPVSCNVDPSPTELQRTVTISKFPESQGNAENICGARTVTLATMDWAEKIMSGYRENLDYAEIMGFVISTGDRINIPFQPEWLEKKQQEMQAKQNDAEHPDIRRGRRPNRPRRPPESFIPRSFQSAIISVKPEGKAFWRITDETKFEFENTDFEKLFAPYRLKPKNLVNVIPISKQLFVEDTEFTIPSLEIYSDMMKLIWYSHQRIKIPESDFGDPLKMDKIQEMTHSHDSPRLIITIKDDLGNQYVNVNEGGGGGGSSGPDPSTREIVSDFSWNQFFSPTLDKNAKEIIVTIKEIHWLKRNRNASHMMSPPPTKPPFMTPIEPRFLPKIIIAEGPWEYRIPINHPPE